MIQLSDEQFNSAAMIGLGRAVLFARQEGANTNKDTVRQITLHNTAYDAQIEGTRSWYAAQIIRSTGNVGDYLEVLRQEIERTLPNNDRDEWHRLAIVGKFVEDGSTELRRFLYDRTAANIAAGYNAGIAETIALDGSVGLDFVIGQYSKTGHDLADLYYDLQNGVADRPELENLPIVKQMRERHEAERAINKSTRPQILSYVDYKKLIESHPKKLRAYPGRWAKNASDDELQNAAADMLAIPASDHDRLLAYISIFVQRTFPLDPLPLIGMARKYDGGPIRTDDGKIIPSQFLPFRAFIALANVSHPAVREFALETIRSGTLFDRAVDLLENNYQPGDWSLISDVVQRQHPREVLHSIGMSVREIARKYPSVEASVSLLSLIERAPCSHCRHSLLKLAHDSGMLPELMIEESPFDSYEDTREWAKNLTTAPH